MKLGAVDKITFGLPVGLILGFYFGSGAVEGVVSRVMEKRQTGI